MTNTDNVSPKLRKIEKEIDNYYKSNPLLKLPFATAASYLLRSAEEYMLNEQIDGIVGIQDRHALGSDFINEIEHPVSWLHRDCEQDGEIHFAYDPDIHKASKDLFELGQKYDLIVFAYTYATDGVLELELQESTIQPTGGFFTSIEYEAYNILIDAHELQEAQPDLNPRNSPATAILDSVRVQGDRFRYKLNPRMVADMKKYLEPLFDGMFLLPSDWEFSRYTLGDFRKVFEVVSLFSSKHMGIQLINERLSIRVRICFQEGLKGLKSQQPTFETLIITGHQLFQGLFGAGKAIKIVVLVSFFSQRCVEVLCHLLRCCFLNACVGLCVIRASMVSYTYWTKTR